MIVFDGFELIKERNTTGVPKPFFLLFLQFLCSRADQPAYANPRRRILDSYEE
jgi:hypothetical protein